MPEPPSGASRNLGLSTVAFALCFSAWGLMAPLARRFEDDLDLTSTETAVLIAIPRCPRSSRRRRTPPRVRAADAEPPEVSAASR